MRLPTSGWKWHVVRTRQLAPIAALALQQHLVLAVAPSAHGLVTWQLPPAVFLSGRVLPPCLFHWHCSGHPKSRSCSPWAQVHPCAVRQQCHLGELPRIGKSAKIWVSVHIFALLQCHCVYASRRAFQNVNYLLCILQLIYHAALETRFKSKQLSQHPHCLLVSACEDLCHHGFPKYESACRWSAQLHTAVLVPSSRSALRTGLLLLFQ